MEFKSKDGATLSSEANPLNPPVVAMATVMQIHQDIFATAVPGTSISKWQYPPPQEAPVEPYTMVLFFVLCIKMEFIVQRLCSTATVFILAVSAE